MLLQMRLTEAVSELQRGPDFASRVRQQTLLRTDEAWSRQLARFHAACAEPRATLFDDRAVAAAFDALLEGVKLDSVRSLFAGAR